MGRIEHISAKAAVRRAVVISPASSGSLGDQAMLEAVTAHLGGEAGYAVRIVPNDHVLRTDAGAPNPSSGAGRLAASLAAVARADVVGVIGADILDGVYGHASVMNRMRLVQVAHAMGKRTRVFGSSFSATPSERMVAFLRDATWLDLCARDGISQARIREATGRDAALVADLAFLLEPALTSPAAEEAAAWVRARRADGHAVIGVNIGGRVASSHGAALRSGLVASLEAVLDADPARSLLFIPHDTRPGAVGDVAAIEAVAAALPERLAARHRTVAAPIHAWDAKALAGMLDAVLVSRMHLAIAALGMGVPPLCLVYLGKFEGMLAHFGLDGCTLEPAACLEPGRLADALERHLRDAPRLRATIAAALPRVRDLARANFAGL